MIKMMRHQVNSFFPLLAGDRFDNFCVFIGSAIELVGIAIDCGDQRGPRNQIAHHGREKVGVREFCQQQMEAAG